MKGSGAINTGQAQLLLEVAAVTPSPSYRKIKLTKGQVALVSVEDHPRISLHRWQAGWNHCTRSFYARRTEKGKTIWMHKEILGIGDAEKGDHINRKTLDNRRLNLREATQSQNCMNRNKRSDNTSGFPGVSWCGTFGKWKVFVSIEKKQKTVGYRRELEDAVALRKQYADQTYKEFVPV